MCDGLGFIGYDVPISDPRFGRLYRCPNNPPEHDSERRERLRAISNLGAFADKTFASFRLDGLMLTDHERESLSLAYKTARRYAERPDGWLLLTGGYGCGKTHLAAAVGNARLDWGDHVLFVTAPDLLDHLRSTFGPNSEVAYDQMFDRIRGAQLLIIDDLGAENPSQWAQEKLFQLLNHRYSYRLPTVITTNVELDALDARIRSRLADDRVVRRIAIAAPDFRTPRASVQNEITPIASYSDMTFDTFDIHTGLAHDDQSNLKFALKAAMRFAEQPEGWLVFTGLYGSGKTHLAAAIANAHYQRQRQFTTLFVNVSDLVDYLRQMMGGNSANQALFEQRLRAVRNAPVLILDDLGGSELTPFWRDKLFQLLDHRYMRVLPTVITTARTIEELDKRLVSRLLDTRRCTLVAITVKSYAERKSAGRSLWP
ncbi:MAG: ATP-binding protein [Aggregatilineales bacterium]